MTGWICFAFAAGLIIGAVSTMIWGLYLSRKNLKKIGAVAENVIPVRGTIK